MLSFGIQQMHVILMPYLNSCVYLRFDCIAAISLDLFFQKPKPIVHLLLRRAVHDDRVQADPYKGQRQGSEVRSDDHLDLLKSRQQVAEYFGKSLVFKYRCICLDTVALFHVKMSMLTLLTLRANNLFQELLPLQHAMHLQ